jgi:hypothetical protein
MSRASGPQHLVVTRRSIACFACVRCRFAPAGVGTVTSMLPLLALPSGNGHVPVACRPLADAGAPDGGRTGVLTALAPNPEVPHPQQGTSGTWNSSAVLCARLARAGLTVPDAIGLLATSSACRSAIRGDPIRREPSTRAPWPAPTTGASSTRRRHCALDLPRHGSGMPTTDLLPLIAADPRTPAAFRAACLRFAAPARSSAWWPQVLSALAGNPQLTDTEVDTLAARGGPGVLLALLRRPGTTAEQALTLLGCTPAGRGPSAGTPSVAALQTALRCVPDPDGLLAAHVLAHSSAPGPLRYLLEAALDDHTRLAAALLLATPDSHGRTRMISADLRGHIGDLTARVPGARQAVLARTTHPQLRFDLEQLGRAVTADPRAVPDEHSPAAAWHSWLLHPDVTAADVVAAAAEAGPLPGTLRTFVWELALRTVPDPDGVLTDAVRAVGGAHLLTRITTQANLRRDQRRAAALALLTHYPTLTRAALLATLDLLRDAPVSYLRQVAAAATNQEVLAVVLSRPDVATQNLSTLADRRVRSQQGFGGWNAYSWARTLLSAWTVAPELLRSAAADLRPGGVGRWPFSAGGDRFWAAVTNAARDAGTGPALDRVGGASILGLPVTEWQLLNQPGDMPMFPSWVHAALTPVLPALADPATAAGVLALAGSGTFTGTLPELLLVAPALIGDHPGP